MSEDEGNYYFYTNKGRTYQFDLDDLSTEELKKFEKMSEKQRLRFIANFELQKETAFQDSISLKPTITEARNEEYNKYALLKQKLDEAEALYNYISDDVEGDPDTISILNEDGTVRDEYLELLNSINDNDIKNCMAAFDLKDVSAQMLKKYFKKKIEDLHLTGIKSSFLESLRKSFKNLYEVIDEETDIKQTKDKKSNLSESINKLNDTIENILNSFNQKAQSSKDKRKEKESHVKVEEFEEAKQSEDVENVMVDATQIFKDSLIQLLPKKNININGKLYDVNKVKVMLKDYDFEKLLKYIEKFNMPNIENVLNEFLSIEKEYKNTNIPRYIEYKGEPKPIEAKIETKEEEPKTKEEEPKTIEEDDALPKENPMENEDMEAEIIEDEEELKEETKSPMREKVHKEIDILQGDFNNFSEMFTNIFSHFILLKDIYLKNKDKQHRFPSSFGEFKKDVKNTKGNKARYYIKDKKQVILINVENNIMKLEYIEDGRDMLNITLNLDTKEYKINSPFYQIKATFTPNRENKISFELYRFDKKRNMKTKFDNEEFYGKGYTPKVKLSFYGKTSEGGSYKTTYTSGSLVDKIRDRFLKGIKGELSNLNEEVSGLKKNDTNFKDNIDKLTDKLNELEKTITSLKESLSSKPQPKPELPTPKPSKPSFLDDIKQNPFSGLKPVKPYTPPEKEKTDLEKALDERRKDIEYSEDEEEDYEWGEGYGDKNKRRVKLLEFLNSLN